MPADTPQNIVVMLDRLVDAIVSYADAEMPYRRGAQREKDEAYEAIIAAWNRRASPAAQPEPTDDTAAKQRHEVRVKAEGFDQVLTGPVELMKPTRAEGEELRPSNEQVKGSKT